MEKTEYIERTDVGVSLQVTIKNGTGTYDQAEVRAKFKGETADDARADYEAHKESLLYGVMTEAREQQRAIKAADERAEEGN